MNRQSALILAFSVAFAVLLISPPFLHMRLAFYPLMEVADATDILTPLILLPLYWLLFQNRRDVAVGLPSAAVFMLLAALWVQGQGMHLAANSIGHLLDESVQLDAYALTNFYDETLSHYLWHVGIAGLSAMLVWGNWRAAIDMRAPDMVAVGFGAIVYGATFFIITIEGVTVPIGLPFSIILVAVTLIWARGRIVTHPTLAFFLLAHALALILYAIWAVMWGGFPEFSEVGIID